MKLTEQEAIQKLDILITFFKEFNKLFEDPTWVISGPGSGPGSIGYPSDF